MRIAIQEAMKGIEKGNRPFGAILVKNGKVVAKAHNTVDEDNDPTAHAELNVIREFSKKMGSWDLSDYTIYSTCEPCPMCTSAIAWANIRKLIFGSQRDDFEGKYRRQFSVWPEKFYEQENLKIEVISGVLRDEIIELYKEYQKHHNKTSS